MNRPAMGEIRQFARTYLNTMDPEQAAAAIGARDGTALLGKKEVTQQIDKQRQTLRTQLSQTDVVRYLAGLAFGRCNDCVKLALEEEPAVDELDLRLLTEIKRNEKGTVEVKLMDRLAVLERLERLIGDHNSSADNFLAAMNAACEEL